ncbi:hypothetical protein B0A55_04902 [Friedmanniomyces simplex]|uniref:Uncharacterized protein n=1 Tax=Friedmanniomyces simplex TaxID=329884 RepID=A0A4U0XIN8_9PEZI|nr:hypothetical protein B0A55_04902 [Friedmanniomyces simplex]
MNIAPIKRQPEQFAASPEASQTNVTRPTTTTTPEMAHGSPSLLFKLPAELREMIYDYAFADTVMVLGGHFAGTEHLPPSRYPSLLTTSKTNQAPGAPALLQAQRLPHQP